MINPVNKLNLAVWQGESVSGCIDANVKEIERVALLSAQKNTEVLVFPECFLTGYYTPNNVFNIAAKVNNDVVVKIQNISRKYNLVIILGTYIVDEGNVYNAALVVNPKDNSVEYYFKTMLYGEWEKNSFNPGVEPLIFNWNGFKIGVLICFDVEFPELTRSLANLGADIIVVPTALMKPFENIAKLLVPTRAIENGVYLAYANRIGKESEIDYTGNSCIISPSGEELARGSCDSHELLFAQISKDEITAIRQNVNYLSEARNKTQKSLETPHGFKASRFDLYTK